MLSGLVAGREEGGEGWRAARNNNVSRMGHGYFMFYYLRARAQKHGRTREIYDGLLRANQVFRLFGLKTRGQPEGITELGRCGSDTLLTRPFTFPNFPSSPTDRANKKSRET